MTVLRSDTALFSRSVLISPKMDSNLFKASIKELYISVLNDLSYYQPIISFATNSSYSTFISKPSAD